MPSGWGSNCWLTKMDSVVVAVAHDAFWGMGLSGVIGFLGGGVLREWVLLEIVGQRYLYPHSVYKKGRLRSWRMEKQEYTKAQKNRWKMMSIYCQ